MEELCSCWQVGRPLQVSTDFRQLKRPDLVKASVFKHFHDMRVEIGRSLVDQCVALENLLQVVRLDRDRTFDDRALEFVEEEFSRISGRTERVDNLRKLLVV